MPAGRTATNIGGMSIARVGRCRAVPQGCQPAVLGARRVATCPSARGPPNFSVNMAMLFGGTSQGRPQTQAPGNPLTGAYGRPTAGSSSLSMLQPTSIAGVRGLMGLDE